MSGERHIVHVLRAPVGGLFRHVRDLARAQAAAGDRVGVIADAATGDRLTDDRLAALVPHLSLGLHRVPMAREPGPRDISAVVATARILRKTAASIVHGHGAKGGAYARLAPRLMAASGRPLAFYTPHGGSLHYPPRSVTGRLYMTLERQLAPWTDGIVFESAYSARLFSERIKMTDLPTANVPNGLGAEEFEPVMPNGDATDFLFVGELRLLKGVDCLIDAVAALRATGLAATLTCVGDGPDKADFMRRAEALGLGTAVSFPGSMPAREAFRLGRVLVVPSRAESFPYIVLEGAAAGLPLIASDVGGIPEMVAGTGQRLLPPGDVAALTSAMRTALHDLASGEDVLQNGARTLRAAVERKFTIATMAAGIDRLYRDAAPSLPRTAVVAAG